MTKGCITMKKEQHAKVGFWASMTVESPIARNPLIEFLLGLFSERDEEDSGESKDTNGSKTGGGSKHPRPLERLRGKE